MDQKVPAYTASIHHDGSGRYVQLLYGQLAINDQVTIRLRAALDAPIEHILVRTCPDGEQRFTSMQPQEADQACRWWAAALRMDMPLVNYRFLLFTADGIWWYNAAGLQRHNPTDENDFRLLAGYQAPAWVRDSVFYQIFPDRFADGDLSTNVKDDEYIYHGFPALSRPWGQPPMSGGGQAMVEFYGGDLLGIQQRMDYLAELGVNALYLNPIFTALSNHRYDVVDYENVDPHLGGNQALADLRQATAARDIKLILDIVPNHCGVRHPWFQAALSDPRAPSAEFFTFVKHPDEYASWLGVRSLPKLNYNSQALRGVMYGSPNSIFRRWLRPPYSIDGWRLDVANMLGRQGPDQLGMEVGRGIRQAVKAENPSAYILGENFFDASHQLQGDCWDAVMNYSGFSKPVWYWLSGFYVRQHGTPNRVDSRMSWPTQALVDSWQAFRAAIPWEIARQQFNLLGSHDTDRILALLGGDLARARLAAGLLLTYLGVPSIYYGDEVGLSGASRQTMPWDSTEWNIDLLEFYKELIHLRRTSPALISGGFQVLLVEENALAYLRDADEESIIVVGNRGPVERPAGLLPVWQGGIPDGTVFHELFSGREARVEDGNLQLAAVPVGVEIWKTS